MSKELKFLYQTTINKLVEEQVTETREENGQKVEVKRTVKKLNPIKIALIKPDRKLYKSAELFYAKSLSDYLRAGLLSFSLVAKRYANDGGPLTETEKERIKTLREEAETLQLKLYSLKEGDEMTAQQVVEEKSRVLTRLNNVNNEVNSIQNAYSDIFESTAEMKSRNDTIEWWSLFLTYMDIDGKGYQPVFGDLNYDERMVKLEEIEDQEDPFTIDVIRRMSYLVSFWFTSKNQVTESDFKSMEKVYDEYSSVYKPQEDPSIP